MNAGELLHLDLRALDGQPAVQRYAAGQQLQEAIRQVSHQIGTLMRTAAADATMEADGNRAIAAAALGISPQRLSQLLAGADAPSVVGQRLALLRDAAALMMEHLPADDTAGRRLVGQAMQVLSGQRRLDTVRMRGVATRLEMAYRAVDQSGMTAPERHLLKDMIMLTDEVNRRSSRD